VGGAQKGKRKELGCLICFWEISYRETKETALVWLWGSRGLIELCEEDEKKGLSMGSARKNEEE